MSKNAFSGSRHSRCTNISSSSSVVVNYVVIVVVVVVKHPSPRVRQ